MNKLNDKEIRLSIWEIIIVLGVGLLMSFVAYKRPWLALQVVVITFGFELIRLRKMIKKLNDEVKEVKMANESSG